MGYTIVQPSTQKVNFILDNTPTTITYYLFDANPFHSIVFNNTAPDNAYQVVRVLVIMDQPGRGIGDLLSGSAPPINTVTGGVQWPHQALETCYAWNNKYTPNNSDVNMQGGTGYGIISGREYVNGTAMPGYTPYTYPHPLTILASVVSRMTHGTAGTFDITLPLTGTRGVECRSMLGLEAGNYTMIFTFWNPVTNCGTASTGTVITGPNPNQCTVNLTGVPNAQYTTVTLTGAVDSTGATGKVSGTMGVLVGDVDATGLVDGNDVSAVQAHARQTANSTNFRLDVNATGLIDGNDGSLTQSKLRTFLPSPP